VLSLWNALLVGACGEAAACRAQAPGWRQTPSVWLPGMGARQATPAGRTSGCSHLALGLPILERLGCLLVCWDNPAYMWRIGSCLSA